jgi:hypothetical protein
VTCRPKNLSPCPWLGEEGVELRQDIRWELHLRGSCDLIGAGSKMEAAEIGLSAAEVDAADAVAAAVRGQDEAWRTEGE